jgi:hypothetical protein
MQLESRGSAVRADETTMDDRRGIRRYWPQVLTMLMFVVAGVVAYVVFVGN